MTRTYGTKLARENGAFTPDGTFILLSEDLSATPFVKIWEDGIFGLLLDERPVPARGSRLRMGT